MSCIYLTSQVVYIVRREHSRACAGTIKVFDKVLPGLYIEITVLSIQINGIYDYMYM